MSAATYPITGIPVPSGEPMPTRKEVTAWMNDPTREREVSLFMRAEAAFQALDVTQKLSYFQIAAIHSFPGVSWDGVPNDGGEFCVHDRVTFPTFHRAYMLLFEQVLYENIVSIIDGWKNDGVFDANPSEEELWRNAASQFRLPYWDWAQKQEYTGTFALPQVFTLDQVEILTPEGGKESFSNPLVRFANPSGKTMGDTSMGHNAIPNDGDLPWSCCIGTSRYGILKDPVKPCDPDPDWAPGINNWQSVNQVMQDPIRPAQEINPNLTEMVGRVLAPNVFSCWEAFASTIYVEEDRKPISKNAEFISLEYVHNLMHNTTGGLYMNQVSADLDKSHIGLKALGLGHMSDPAVAAFDPIFWFHHCNIDRLMSIWQELNAELWFDNPIPEDPKPSAWLPPFHTTETGGELTSNTIQDRKSLGYDYDDLVPPAGLDITKPEDKIQYLQNLRAHIDTLYPHTAQIVTDVPGVVQRRRFDDYIINVAYDRFALDGRAYAIIFYLEDMSVDPEQQHTLLGTMYTFSMPVAACANCRQKQKQKVLSRAQIPLTTSLLAVSGVSAPGIGSFAAAEGGLDENIVARVLKSQLKWQFVEIGGKIRPATDFPNTAIKVLVGSGYLREPDADTDFGGFVQDARTYGDYKQLKTAEGDSLLGDDRDDRTNALIPDD